MDKQQIFFINPSEKQFLNNAGDRYPLGLMYLSSFMKSKGYTTQIWDLNHADQETMLKEAKISGANYFCIGIATPLYRKALELAQRIRTEIPNAILVAGGYHVTDIPDEPLTLNNFDYVIIGEGEEGMLRIVTGNAVEQKVYSKPLDDLDQVPMPDYEGVKMELYTMQVDGLQGASIVSSRGCTYNCTYCGSAASLNKAKMKVYRERSPANVVAEMKLLYHKYSKRAFYFGDDIFTKNKKRVLEMCDLIKKEMPDITWRATTRADLLDEELITAMKGAGCNIVSLGIESGSNQILKNIQKGMTFDQNKKTIDLCHKHGIKIKGFFIFPLPGDTEETFRETVEFAKSLKLEYCDIYPLTPYPGTQFWNNPEKHGLEIFKPKDGDWDNYYQVGKDGANHELKFKHPNFTTERIHELINKFQKEVGVQGLTYK